MRKNLYFIIYCLFIAFLNNICSLQAQNGSCAGAAPFCGDEGVTYPAGVNNGNSQPSGNSYSCGGGAWQTLFTQPNAAWFYFEISESGPIIITMTNTNNVDVDFACWGPYSNLNNALNNCGSLPGAVDCSYNPQAVEVVNVTGQVGDIFLLMITNFSNQPTQIIADQTNLGAAGAGATNCNILNECNLIINNSPNIEICNNAGTVQLTASYTGVPQDVATWHWTSTSAAGTAALGGNANQQNPTLTISPTFSGTMGFTVTLDDDVCDPMTDNLIVTVNPTPNPQPQSLTACSNNPGGANATFNLLQLNSALTAGVSGGTVNWYQGPGTNNPIGNPGSYTTSGGTIVAQVSSADGCSKTVNVTLTVIPKPTATNQTLSGCETSQGSGVGTYNLSSLSASIGNGAVSFFAGPGTTNPINNPAAYVGPPGSIVAMVASSDPNCFNTAIITLTLTAALDCDDGVCANGVETWNAATCSCQDGPDPAPEECAQCPQVTNALNATQDLCEGDAPSLASLTSQVSYTDAFSQFGGFQWYLNPNLSTALPAGYTVSTNENCNPGLVTLYLGIKCNLNNTVSQAGQVTLSIYPDFDASLLQLDDGEECVVPTLTSLCANYDISANTGSSLQPGDAVPPGTSGTVTFTISYNGQNCFAPQTQSAPFSCPDCPTISNPFMGSVSICSNEAPVLADYETQASGSIIDPDDTFSDFQWYSDAALTTPVNFSAYQYNGNYCNPEETTIYLGIICTLTPEPIPAGELQMTIYPSSISSGAWTNLLNITNNECEPPNIEFDCGAAGTQLVATPVPGTVPPSVGPGESGTAQWVITMAGSDCLEETYSVDYNCPEEPTCPALLKGIEEFVENCSGNVIDLLQYESGIQLYDNCVELIGEPCFNGFAWFENESLTMPVDTFAEAPFNPTNSFTHPNPGSCSPENITLYVGFYCTLDGFVSGPYFAGTLTISTFPSYDESLITVLNEGDCDNFPPNVVSQCLGWTIEADDSNPDDIKPGESGDYLFNVVQYNLTGDECFNEPFSVPYECPPICEEFDLLNSVPATACNGDTITLKTTVSTIEDTAIINSDYSVQWYKNGTAIAGATALKYVATFNAVGCDPVTDWYSVTYTCIKPGNSTITLNADTVTIYPEYDPDFIEVAPYFLCEAPTIEVNCDNYTATLVASPDAIGAGDYVWEISYSDTTGQSCWDEVYEVSTFYTCTCPTIPNNYNDDIAICADDVLNLGAISNLLPDPIGGDDVTYGGYAWFLDAAYTQPFPNNYGYNGDNCTAFKDTLYVAYQCAAAGIDTLLLPAGVLQVTIYPPYDATLMSIDTAECEVPQLLSSCSEYLIAPVDVPTSVEPGDTGVAVFQIQYGDAPTCWTETYPVDYYCPYIPVCPLINTPLDGTLALCSTSVFDFSDYEAMIDSSDIDNTGIEYLWFTNAALTQAAGSESSFQHSGADNCEAESITLYIGLRCSLQNELIPAGTLQLVMYPDYDVSFITPSAAGECTVPSITVNCDNYIITPDPANITQFEPGTSGTNSWMISFDGGPNDNPCFSNVYTLPYQCPPCPEVSVSTVPQDICSGESITLQATVTPANAIFGLDYEVQWYDNGAPIAGANTLLEVIDLDNENCDPETHIYTLQFTCLFPITETQSVDVGTVLVNPAYNDTFVTLSNTADCEAPTLTSTCDNYTITPNANNVNVVLPNSSGTNSWTITYNGSNCFSENISEDYECPACPTATAAAPPTTVCSGETITLSAVISPADAVLGQDYALQWLDNGVPIAGATTAAYDINTMNNTCDTETHNYTLAFNCLFPENTTTDITAGSVIVTPAYNADFINTNNAVCAVPTLTGTCDNYFIVPQNVPTAVLPDESGTAVWQISYSGSNCWTEDISIDYACACPTVTTPAAGTLTLCNGEQPDLAALAAQIQFTDPANLTTSVQWYSDAALTTPFAPALLANTACDPLQVTIYAGITCFSATPTPIAAGQVAITVYPSFNASFIQKNAGDCANPILSSTCNQYILTPDVGNSNNTTIPGNSGFWNWTITYNGSDCFSVQDSVPFVCGAVCPTVSLGSIPISLCNGEILSLSAEVVPSGAVLGTDFEVQWLQNGQPVAGANDLTYQLPLTASGCNVTAYTFELLFTCLNPGAPAQTFNAGTINVFPDYDTAFINEYNTACTVPQIEATCSSYSINVVNVPAQVLAGDNGTATWQITYNNNNCWTETYSVAYDCPFVPGCPLVTNPLNGNINLCIGESPDFAALSNQIQYNDPDNLAGTINFYTDNALTNIATAAAYTYSGDGCAPQNVTLYAGLQCNAATPTVLAAGSVLLTLYPDYNADFISENAPLCAVPQITSSCNNYSITATNVPAQVLAGDNGTATWQITYNNSTCWTETYNVNYSCAAIPLCPVITQSLNTSVELCYGAAPNFAALSNQIQYNDPDNLAGNIIFYSDAALNNVVTISDYLHSGNNTCNTENITLYAGLVCENTPQSIIPAGSVTCLLFPEYDASLLTAQSGNDCEAPTLNTTCPNYIITPSPNNDDDIQNGESGNFNWTITYNDGVNGQSCFEENYTAPYTCGEVCPVVSISVAAPATACSGETITMTAAISPANAIAGIDYSLQWYQGNFPIPLANGLQYAAIVTNTDCETSALQFSLQYTCLNPGAPPQILDAGTTIIYPDYNQNVLQEVQVACQVPQLNSTCNNYIITPVDVPSSVNAGDSGTAVWQVTYESSGCWSENYSYDYNIPLTCATCPSVTTPISEDVLLCSGTTPDLLAAAANLVFDDPDNTAGAVQWFSNAALTTPVTAADWQHSGGDNCEVETVTLFAALPCSVPPASLLSAGTLTLTLYPDFDAALLTETEGDCEASSLVSTCANYILTAASSNISGTVQAGESGINTWTVTFSGNNCFSEEIDVFYSCGEVCPQLADIDLQNITLCSGEAIILNDLVSVLPATAQLGTDYSLQWYINGVEVSGATAADFSYTQTTNTNCEPEILNVSLKFTCLVPAGNAPQTISVAQVSVYPAFNNELLISGDGQCQLPQLSSSCAQYQISIVGTPPQVAAGDTGVVQYNITYAANACFNEILSLNYLCPEIPPTKEIYIPTAFSPNNDNVNDIFRALSNYPLSEFNMMIYNRWGNLVFSSNDISIGWNGYTATDENDMEVFVYYCNVTFDDGEKKTYKGNVTLVR